MQMFSTVLSLILLRILFAIVVKIRKENFTIQEEFQLLPLIVGLG
jgi:hypothetical protein